MANPAPIGSDVQSGTYRCTPLLDRPGERHREVLPVDWLLDVVVRAATKRLHSQVVLAVAGD